MNSLLVVVGGCGSSWNYSWRKWVVVGSLFFFDGSGWLLGGFLVVMVRYGNFG